MAESGPTQLPAEQRIAGSNPALGSRPPVQSREKRAQFDAVETLHAVLQSAIDRGQIDTSGLDDIDTVLQATFNVTESGLASLRLQVNTRQRKVFETVRQLSDLADSNYVEEFAETIDGLGDFALLGTRYREEVLDEPPGSTIAIK